MWEISCRVFFNGFMEGELNAKLYLCGGYMKSYVNVNMYF